MSTIQQGEERNTIASSDSSKETEVIRTERLGTSGDRREKGSLQMEILSRPKCKSLLQAKRLRGKKYSFKVREVTEKEIVQSKQGDKRLRTEVK